MPRALEIVNLMASNHKKPEYPENTHPSRQIPVLVSVAAGPLAQILTGTRSILRINAGRRHRAFPDREVWRGADSELIPND